MFKSIKTLFNLLSDFQKRVFVYSIMLICFAVIIGILFNLYNVTKKSYRLVRLNKQNYEYVNQKATQINDILDVNFLLSKNSDVSALIETRSKQYNLEDLIFKNKDSKFLIEFNTSSIEDNILFLNDVLGLTKLPLSMLKISQLDSMYRIQIELN